MTERERASRFAKRLRRWASTAEKRREYAKARELRELADKNEAFARAEA